MERIEDCLACTIFVNTMKDWYKRTTDLPSWDSLTEDQRDIYREAARRRLNGLPITA
jgi:hypothetical protein